MSECGNPEDLLEFPCHYTFKAVGLSGDVFLAEVTTAVNAHAVMHSDSIRVRPSGQGKYQAVSIVVRLENYSQLTSIYAELKKIPDLKMLL